MSPAPTEYQTVRALASQTRSLPKRTSSRATALVIALAMTATISAMAYVPAGDHETIQGGWRAIDAHARIGTEPATTLEGVAGHGTITFAGNKVTMLDVGNGRDSSSTFAFTLDTVTTPRRIHLIGEGSPDGNRWSGIYRITGDSLRLSLPIEHWTDRPAPPTEFGAPNTVTLILKREQR